MFCRNCSKEIADEAVICIHCGSIPKKGKNFCYNCGSITDLTDSICMHCGVRLNVLAYAGFWRRVAAYIIDGLVLMPATLILYGITLASAIIGEEGFAGGVILYEIFAIALVWLYYALMESSSYQATVGKMAIGIIVTDLNGGRISFSKACGRYFGKIISGLIVGIGFLMAGFTAKKQALHDIMAGCLVIVKNR